MIGAGLALGLSVGMASASGGPTPPPVEEVRLGELLELMREWRLVLLAVAAVVVIAILWAGDVIRPGSLGRSGMREVKDYPGLAWLFAGLVVYLTLAMGAGFAAQQGWITGNAPSDSVRYLGAVHGAGMLIAGTVGLGMAYLMARGVAKTGLRVHPADLPIGLLAFILVYPIVALVSLLAVSAHGAIASDAPERLAHPLLRALEGNYGDPWAWVLIAAVVVGAPIVEELVYRGFLQSALLRWFKSPWAAITVTSIIFALAHAGFGGGAGVPWYAVVTLFVLSIALGLAFERTRHLGTPIVMHMAFNALNIAMAA